MSSRVFQLFIGLVVIVGVTYIYSHSERVVTAKPKAVVKASAKSIDVPNERNSEAGVEATEPAIVVVSSGITAEVVMPDSPKKKRRRVVRSRPALQKAGPRRSTLQQSQWAELNEILRLHLSPDVAVKVAALLEDHCIERALIPRPKREATDTNEVYLEKMRDWAIESRSVGKSEELHQLIPELELKKKVYTHKLMGLLHKSCPVGE